MELPCINPNVLNETFEEKKQTKIEVLNKIAMIQAILDTSEVITSNKQKALELWNEIQMCLRYQLNIAKAEFDNACKECKVEDDFYTAIYTAIYDLQKIIKQRMIFSYSEEALLSNMNLLFFKFKAFLHDSCSR